MHHDGARHDPDDGVEARLLRVPLGHDPVRLRRRVRRPPRTRLHGEHRQAAPRAHTHDALKSLGVSVFWGMLTSPRPSAAPCLRRARLQFLAKFGTFFRLTILWAYLWAVLFLMPLLATTGQSPRRGRAIRAFARCGRAAGHQDDAGTNGQGTMPPQYPDPLWVPPHPPSPSPQTAPASSPRAVPLPAWAHCDI